jgi:hypothetical protein
MRSMTMKTLRDSCCRAADGGGAPSGASSCGRLQGHHSTDSVDTNFHETEWGIAIATGH